MTSIEGRHYQTGRAVSVQTDGVMIVTIKDLGDTADQTLPWIAPGLVDSQVNGYRGFDFNADPLNDTQTADAVSHLWRDGVTTFMPTIITQSADKMVELAASWSVLDGYPDLQSSVMGVHLEGPFLSTEDGPRGAHSKEWIRPPDYQLIRTCQTASHGRIRLVTLSPEWDGAVDLIRSLRLPQMEF